MAMIASEAGRKADPRSNPTACNCPVCGAAATYDLAPNPGLRAGGPHAPPPPPPEVLTPTPEPPPPPGDWYLVVCSGPTGSGVGHRTLWPESRLGELTAPGPYQEKAQPPQQPPPKSPPPPAHHGPAPAGAPWPPYGR